MPPKLKFKCACEQIFIADERLFGKKIRCPKCKRAVRVPVPPGSTPTAAAEPVDPSAPVPDAEPVEPEPEPEPVPAEPDDGSGAVKASADGLEIVFEDPTEIEVAHTESLFGDVEPLPGQTPEVEFITPAAIPAAGAPAAAPAAEGEPAGEGQPDPTTLTSCPHCGQDLPPASVFCINCGTDLRTGRKMRRAAAQAGEGRSYDPPEEGNCCLCGAEGVLVVLVQREEFVESKKVMKLVRKDMDVKKPSDHELQTALSVKIGGGESRPLCGKCTKTYKIGPRKFTEFIWDEELGEPAETGDKAGEEKPKKKGGLFGKLFGKKEKKKAENGDK